MGCAGYLVAFLPPAAAKYENVRRIGVISAIGDLFTAQKVGVTAFGNDVKELSIAPWNIDAFVIAKVRSALAGRFEVRPVSYAEREPVGATEHSTIHPFRVHPRPSDSLRPRGFP